MTSPLLEFERTSELKPPLYLLRVLLTGAHLMRTGNRLTLPYSTISMSETRSPAKRYTWVTVRSNSTAPARSRTT